MLNAPLSPCLLTATLSRSKMSERKRPEVKFATGWACVAVPSSFCFRRHGRAKFFPAGALTGRSGIVLRECAFFLVVNEIFDDQASGLSFLDTFDRFQFFVEESVIEQHHLQALLGDQGAKLEDSCFVLRTRLRRQFVDVYRQSGVELRDRFNLSSQMRRIHACGRPNVMTFAMSSGKVNANQRHVQAVGRQRDDATDPRYQLLVRGLDQSSVAIPAH